MATKNSKAKAETTNEASSTKATDALAKQTESDATDKAAAAKKSAAGSKASAKKTVAAKSAAAKPKAKAATKAASTEKTAITKKAATTPTVATKKPRDSRAKPKASASKPKSATDAGNSEVTSFEPYTETKTEDYMNEAQHQHFRDILNAWKAELMEEVDRTVSHMKDEAANFPDPADRASQEEEFSLELRTRDRERKLIRKIDSTLDLIDQDEYGFCEACGVEIGIRRLEARPTATQCIDCKTLDEIKERQVRG